MIKTDFFLNLSYYFPTAKLQLGSTIKKKKYVINKEQVLGIISDKKYLVHNLYIQLQRIDRKKCIPEKLFLYLLKKPNIFSKYFFKNILISIQDIKKLTFRDII